jgi:hypothetical protein
MTTSPPAAEDRYAHLRSYAAAQKQATVDRLKDAIMRLEADGRPVNTFTIKEVSGLDYMAYYRNPEALALFRTHSTHLRKEREKEQANRQRVSRKRSRQDDNLHQVKAESRDPLLDYKRPRLVQLLHEARTACDQIKQQAQTKQAETEQRYSRLLQEHMQCALRIARLEAELAEFKAFMERFRASLQREEQGP